MYVYLFSSGHLDSTKKQLVVSPLVAKKIVTIKNQNVTYLHYY